MGKADCSPATEVLVPLFLVSTAVLTFAFSFPTHAQLPELRRLLCDTHRAIPVSACYSLSLDSLPSSPHVAVAS